MVSKDDHSDDLVAIEELLLAAFGPKQLERFCNRRPLFRPILANFGPKYNLNDMVDEVLDYCDRHILLDQLLSEIEKQNPRQYNRYKDRIRSPSEPDKDAPPRDEGVEPTPPVSEGPPADKKTEEAPVSKTTEEPPVSKTTEGPPAGKKTEQPPVSEEDEEPSPVELPTVKGIILRVLVAAILIAVVSLVLFAVLGENGLPCGPRINPTTAPATMETDLPSGPVTAGPDTPTLTMIPSLTATLSPTHTSTPSGTTGLSATPRLPSHTGSSSSTLTATLTITPTLTPTLKPTQPPSPTPTKTPTATATPTYTPSPTPTATPTPEPPPPPSPTPIPPTLTPAPTDTRIPPTP